MKYHSEDIISVGIDTEKEVFNSVLVPEEAVEIKIYGLAALKEELISDEKEKGQFIKIDIEDFSQARLSYSCENIYGATTIGKPVLNIINVSENGWVSPGKDGGIAEITVKVKFDGGKEFEAKKRFINRPFYREYERTLTMKLLLNCPEWPNHANMYNFEQALQLIKEVDNLTCGIPKIIYLVGWQKGGHDHQWPDWSVVDDNLKRPEDPDGLTSLKWLIKEGKKYNTTVSLHLNMFDISLDSPLLNEYIEKDIVSRNFDGSLREKVDEGVISPVVNHYMISYTREWQEGLAQRRIDKVLEMVPEIVEGGTVHVDAFHSWWFDSEHQGKKAISPYHAKEYGIYAEQETDTQRKIYEYFRNKGLDVTSECVTTLRISDFIGLQAMAWWGIQDLNPMEIPACLYAGGQGRKLRYGENLHGEDIFVNNRIGKKEPTEGFLRRFCLSTLQFQYLNNERRLSENETTVFYSNDITATDNRVMQGDTIIRDGGDVFTPALWCTKKAIIAYSSDGYENRLWNMPREWSNISKVDIYNISKDGQELMVRGKAVDEGRLGLSLKADQGIFIVPASV